MKLEQFSRQPHQGQTVKSTDAFPYRTLSAMVVDKIGQWIINGTLAKGQRIVIKNIANEIGVSEMPVREALKVLEAQGLVESIPYRGAWVKELSLEDIKELYMLRELLESKAAALAVVKITRVQITHLENIADKVKVAISAQDSMGYFNTNQEFHLSLYAVSGCVHMCNHICSIWESLAYYRLVYSVPFMMNHAIEEHEQYLDACRSRDADYAAELVKINLKQHVDYLVHQLQ